MMEIVWAVIFLAGAFALLVDSFGSLSKDVGIKELNERVEELERQLDILFDYVTERFSDENISDLRERVDAIEPVLSSVYRDLNDMTKIIERIQDK